MLNQTRIIRLPLHYGPGVVSRTLKKIIQALVDSAVNPAQVFNNLVTAPSNCTITGKIVRIKIVKVGCSLSLFFPPPLNRND